ncbi:MAG: leucyl aminopeptidase [Myxococcota bacterium]
MNVHYSTASAADAAVGLLAVGVSKADANDLTRALSSLGDLAASIAASIHTHDFTGAAGQSIIVASLGRIPARYIAVVGLGESSDDEYRRAAGAAGKEARERRVTSAALSLGDLSPAQTRAVMEGFAAGNYRFDKYKTRERDQKPAVEDLHVFGAADASVQDKTQAIIAGQTLTRDLVNEPAAVIYPEALAQVARDLANDQITVTIWDEKKIVEENMGGITAVGQGSDRPARFIHLHYRPTGEARQTVALCGKGVTFDAGGLSLKSSAGMQTMRCDMGGSGVVLGVFRALADIRPDVEVHGIIGAVENMVNGNSFKLGDILHIRNGKTVEIHNTDAEGRLVLADCLSYACELKPDTIIDLATLTGAAVVALGEYYSALFTNYDDLAAELHRSADDAGEGLWRMPLPDFYKDKLKAEWADVKNVGGRAAGSTTAALFLSEFVEDGIPWAHLDIAGPTFFNTAFRHFRPGGTGQMVSTLTRWLTD